MNEDALWVIDQLQQGHDLRCQPPMSFSMAQSIFSGAQYVTPQKYSLTSKFSYLLFSNLSHKTETGTANRWETTNSNPTWTNQTI
jgi:hypothetical protein